MKKNFKIIIALLLLSILIFLGHNIVELNHQIIENQYNTLVYDLGNVSTNFNIWITEKEAILNSAKDIVDNFTYEEIFTDHTLNNYLNINNEDPDISQIYIGTSEGEFYTGGNWIPPDDYDPRTRVWYKEAVEVNATIISDVYIDRETGDSLVTISSPLYMEGDFVGVISADVFLRDISRFIANQIGEKDVYAYLINTDGNIIIHTSRVDLVGKNIYDDVDSLSVNNYLNMAKETYSTVRMKYVFADQEIRGIIQKIGNGEWYIAVASIQEDQLISLFKLMTENNLFNLAILVIIIALLLQVVKIKQWLEQKNLKLTSDNERDFLTGVYNRKYFNLWMEKLWSNEDDCSIISLLMIDIDYFKVYNDTYGHIKGDEALQMVTTIISSNIRKGDLIARYGGEEFTVVLHDVTMEHAIQIAEKIIKSIYDANILNERTPENRITVSIGAITVRLAEGYGVREIVDSADRALYEAKESGRNRLVAYDVEELNPN